MKFRTQYTEDSIGRKIIFEEYIGTEPYERFKKVMLPGTNDRDVVISTKKHGVTTLGKIANTDRAYLEWTVCKSRQTKTIKYAAIRILYGTPYEVPSDGEEYDVSKFFDFNEFLRIARFLNLTVSNV